MLDFVDWYVIWEVWIEAAVSLEIQKRIFRKLTNSVASAAK